MSLPFLIAMDDASGFHAAPSSRRDWLRTQNFPCPDVNELALSLMILGQGLSLLGSIPAESSCIQTNTSKPSARLRWTKWSSFRTEKISSRRSIGNVQLL